MEENIVGQGPDILGTFDDIPDTLTGTDLSEEILARRGDNLVEALGGDDTIFGGPGNDEIRAGEGNDSIFSGTEDDRVFGDEGNDFARGGDGSDSLFGGNGSDTLIGQLGSDSISGNDGNDRLVGEDDNDTLVGGNGSDTLFGGSGSDRLIGVDTISSFGRDTIDTINGEAGSDTFVLGQENAVFYDSNSDSLGTEDYALITDFETERDSLELVGSFNDYSFATTPEGLPDGVGVYLGQESNSELIAILQGVGVSEIEDIQTNIDPIIEFDDLFQTPTLIPDEQGRLEVSITNPGNLTNTTLNLYASTDRILDNEVLNTLSDTIDGTNIDALRGTDELLGTVNIDLAQEGENIFTIDFASSDFENPSVVSPGGYHLIAEVDLGNGNSEIATQFISSDRTDVVLDWNSAFLNAIQAEGKAELGESLTDSSTTATIPGVAPPVVARNGAILHTAIYEAVNALSNNPSGSSLNSLPIIPEGASQEAAAVGAAHTVLSNLFVEEADGLSEGFLIEQQTAFDLQRNRSLVEINDDTAAEEAGFSFGVEIAEAILANRSNDGTAQAQVPYEQSGEPGIYEEYVEERQDPDNQVTALLPDWGEVNPFAIDNVEEFRPENLPEEFEVQGFIEFGTSEYAEQVNEVAELGELTSEVRTEAQTEIAEFWSYDRADTFRPPGQWNQIAQEAVLGQDDLNSIEDNALLFAQLNIAMADAGIVTWDVKYTPGEELLRPVTAIREIGNNIDPEGRINVDPDWEPLLPTPNFSDYISGHSAFGGAAAGVLEDFFGDDVVLELPTQELPGVTRTYSGIGDTSSFVQAAFENADSRLFGGVHIDASNLDGVAVGLAVADNILNEGNIFA